MTPVIFHIDVNSAYLSWTAVEQLKNGAGTDLRKIPSIIGGDQKSRHGVVLAKSIPAKRYGIRTGEPVANAFRKCPNLVIEPPDHKMYREKSRMLMDYLRTFTKEIEQVSVDECYVDMTQAMEGFYSPVDAAMLIKNGVREKFGFTVNVEEIRVKMWPLPIGELYMAGHSSVEILKKLEILTIGDLAQADPRLITLHLKSHGQMLWEFANGIDHSSVQSQQAEAKGVGNSTTLSKDAETLEEIRPVFAHLAASVGERLKKAGQKASMVSMEIKYYDFRKISHQKQLMQPTSDQNVLYESACELFEEVWTGEPVRLLGIRTAKLVDEKEPMQLSIFDIEIPKPLDEKHQKLKDAMEKLDARFGKGTVIKASLMKKEPNTKEKDEKRR